MSSDATQEPAGATAKQAPTEQQESQPGAPRRLTPGQTVCNEKNEKGKLCNGHLKQLNTQHASAVYLRGDDVLHRCQACGALYMGPPMGHVRDPRRQQRYVERDLAAILQAAGGTLPAYDYPVPAWRGEPRPKLKPAGKPAPPPKPAAAAEKPPPAKPPPAPAKPAAPADSSAAADAHRHAAEAQAATGQASAAPLSPTAATASPASGAETVSDLAPEASTERTPAAPRDERVPAAEAKPAPAPKKKAGAHSGFKIADEFRPQENETPEQKIARLKRLAEEAKRASGKL